MNPSDAPLLEVSGLIKRYGGLVAIDRVDLQLQPGTITGVIGPNGAGKSTLIGLIGEAISPTLKAQSGSMAATFRACLRRRGRVRESGAPIRYRVPSWT